MVLLAGEVSKQEDSKKIVLAIGTVVDNNMAVANREPEARYYTVVARDSLSKIAKEMYGLTMKYEAIFEANRLMLSDMDLIYT